MQEDKTWSVEKTEWDTSTPTQLMLADKTEIARAQLKDQLIHIQLDLKAEGNIQHDFQSTPE